MKANILGMHKRTLASFKSNQIQICNRILGFSLVREYLNAYFSLVINYSGSHAVSMILAK